MTGEAWRLRREEQGLTLREVARRVGVSAPFLSDVEHGRRRYSADTEAKAREVLGMEPAAPETPHRCSVCGGEIVVDEWSEYLGDPMLMIIGPGSRNQFTTRRAIYCKDCGVSYHRLPGFRKPDHANPAPSCEAASPAYPVSAASRDPNAGRATGNDAERDGADRSGPSASAKKSASPSGSTP